MEFAVRCLFSGEWESQCGLAWVPLYTVKQQVYIRRTIAAFDKNDDDDDDDDLSSILSEPENTL
jgi:hypothetical protein